jgi:hypothetical protein
MLNWKRALGFGLLAWLLPFVVAVLAFSLRDRARPVFESVMAVGVAATATGLGLAYGIGRTALTARAGVLLGVVWLAMSILVDAPLMLLTGPMQMSLGAYLGDIGLTYVVFPVVTFGLAAAADRARAG